jgi:hypothetical protein
MSWVARVNLRQYASVRLGITRSINATQRRSSPSDDIADGSVNAIRIHKTRARDGFHNDNYDNEE